MTPFLLISRSAEFEARLRSLLGSRLQVITGEFLSFGADFILDMVNGTPRIALLGPVLNYAETRDLVRGLDERNPDMGFIVVREQRSDLEDWVDELKLHAVLSPTASDQTIVDLLNRLAGWMVANGRAEEATFGGPVTTEGPAPADTLTAEVGAGDGGSEAPAGTEHADEDAAAADDEVHPGEEALDAGSAVTTGPESSAGDPSAVEWVFPPLTLGARTEAIAVVAPKGGQGKSTLAINLATGLAEVAPNSVVLIDADLQFGDITAALALDPTHTIVEAVSDDAADEMVFKTTLTHHSDDFFVVASAASPELGDAIQPMAIGRLIERLRAAFRYVIVDTTPGLGEHTLTALEHSTDAVFVTNMGVPSLRALRTEFEILTTLGLMPANRHLVVNFADRMSGLTVKDAEAIIGAPVDIEVPRSSAVLLASNRGVPLIHDDVRDPAAKAIRGLITRIAPEAMPKRVRIHRKRRSNEPV